MSLRLRLFYIPTLRLDKCRIWCGRYSSTQSTTTTDDIIDITSVEETPKYEEVLTERDEEKIMNIRNKSKLAINDRNKLCGLPPYNGEDLTWFHETIRYKKRMFGRYGVKGLNVPVGALWPLKEEVDDKIEFEKTGYPYTVQECWALIAKRNHETADRIRLREEEIAKKMEKVKQWKEEFHGKIMRKEAEILAARKRKEDLIETVRRQFGFKIDSHDERFKLALEQKEKEDRKRKKEMKKQERSARLMAQILSGSVMNNPAKIENIETEKNKE